MNARNRPRGFAARPADPETWIRMAEPKATTTSDAPAYTARLRIDVTPALRGRIKIAAFQRGETVADMLRALLDSAFPVDTGDPG